MKREYYHVVTEEPMTLGQILNFNHNKSGVYKRVMEKKNIVQDIYNNPEKYKNIQLDHHTKVALRELALEEVRRKKFPNYPSRLKSLYVSKNLDDVKMWAESFITQGRKVFSLVVVKTDGNSFTGDAYNCFEGTINHEYNLKQAYKYWNNEPNSKHKRPIYETIINGNIEVVKIIEKYSKN